MRTVTTKLIALSSLSLIASMLMPTVQAASFDCAKASTKVEHIICDNPEISKLDEELEARYQAALQEQPQAEAIKQAQKQWLKVRPTCGDNPSCLGALYQKRIKELGEGISVLVSSKETLDSEETLAEIRKSRPDDKAAYRYELEVNKNDKVCRHMQKVYNTQFQQPWLSLDSSLMPNRSFEDVYSENSIYKFPKFKGVKHFPRYTLSMHFSKLPSSREFEAIQWTEGRRSKVCPNPPDPIASDVIQWADGFCLYPTLAAEFDADNDGKIDTVLKHSFMYGAMPMLSSWGWDAYYVFQKGVVDPASPMTSEQYIARGAKNIPAPSLKLLRPFVFDGLTYWSGYRPEWPRQEEHGLPEGYPPREFTTITKYRGGGEWQERNGFAQPDMELVCRYRMIVIK